MKIVVDRAHRYACMRAHTATHLLHAELWKIFPQTKQAGSYVGPDELRFDFFAERNLTADELAHITDVINAVIYNNETVTVQEMSYEEAIKTGAKAFFEDTYPEVVRVVSIASSSWAERSGVERSPSYDNRQDPSSSSGWRQWILSVELCGGTHVSETSQIGSFFITEQSSVAAGIKRITALTGTKVSTHLQGVQDHLDQIAHKVDVPVKQLDAKLEKIVLELHQANITIADIAEEYVQSLSEDNIAFDSAKIEYVICIDTDKIAGALWFSTIVDALKLTAYNSRVVYTKVWQYALFHPQAKETLKNLTIKWGGSDTFVQGRDEKIVTLLS